jgi:rSAM/selenodomain-associated transferase 1
VSPVIAIMAKAPRPGRVKTRLSPPLSRAAAAALARAFLRDTVGGVARIPHARGAIVFAPTAARPLFARLAPGFRLVPQGSGDLGRRMARAFAALLAPGVPAVVLIGSDAPSLPRAVLERALRVLEAPRTDVVLGPSEDGGYYLIGMRAPHPALFERIAWSTGSVLQTTLARAERQGLRVRMLRRWWDVDTPADLARLRRWLTARPDVELPATRRILGAD